jgi:tetratricopeptide (TPR) repeat protein
MESDKLLSAGKYDRVEELLEYMLELYPGSLNAIMRMGDVKRITGDYESAIKYYDQFLRIKPVDAIAIKNRRDNLVKYINESLVFRLEKDILSLGIDKGIRNFRKSRTSAGNKLTFGENDLNSLGYSLLNRQLIAESIKVFKLALEIYPASANLYDSLGEAYLKNNDKANARKNYEKSLLLNPGNENARLMLEKIK